MGTGVPIGKDHGVDIRNPATGEVLTTIESLTVEQTDAAIVKAAAAFEEWRAVAPGDRARLLRRFAAAVDADIVQLAALEVINAGHVVANARWEAGNVRDVIEFYSGAPERHSGRQIPVPGGVDLTFHEPLGVVGIIVPWNFPMAIAGWGFAPALAAGNTVVLKPAELTPLSALRLGNWRSKPASPRASCRFCRARAAWSAGASSTTPPCAKSASPARPRWAAASWPAAPSRSNG